MLNVVVRQLAEIGKHRIIKFDKNTETVFEQEIQRQCVRSMWFALPITIVLHLLMPLCAIEIFDDASQIIFYHFFVAGGSLILLTMTCWSFFRSRMADIGIFVWTACAAAVAIALSSTRDGIYYYIGAGIFTIIYAGGFIRTTFHRAAICCLIILVSFNLILYVRNFEEKAFLYVNAFLLYATFIGLVSCYFVERLEREKFSLQQQITSERNRIDEILRDILPATIFARIKAGQTHISELNEQATILFCDVVGFTRMASRETPEFVVEFLNDLFSRLDAIAARCGVEKIKTIGDAYMAAAGIGDAAGKDATSIALFALDARRAISETGTRYGINLEMRFGIATGQVISGVIGTARPVFDTWGATVNLASRLESVSMPGEITIDLATADLLDGRFAIAPGGRAVLKGLGEVKVFRLLAEGAAPGSPGA